MFTKAELEVVADLCKKYDVLCVSDEVYEWLVYSGSEHIRIGMSGSPPPPPPQAYFLNLAFSVLAATLPGMWERTVTVSSAGKTFSATGWKVNRQ